MNDMPWLYFFIRAISPTNRVELHYPYFSAFLSSVFKGRFLQLYVLLQSTVTEPLGIPSERQRHGLIHDDTSCTETLEETSQEVSSEITADSAEPREDAVTVCRFFLAGKCHFGPRCRWSHSPAAIADPEPGVPHPDGGNEEEKLEKHKKGKAKKAAKPKYTQENEAVKSKKKLRMRTADDVISRILWDTPADAEHFIVGYLDRFLGVLERPFNEFNWDAEPCDCDYSKELALPRHRIQYFAFRGQRVWDRNGRTDRVFGSTGQSLAPPFGEEGEAGGVGPQDAEQTDSMDSGEALERTEDGQGVESGTVESSTESTHLEEIESTLSAKTALDDTTQEPQPERGEIEAVVDDSFHRVGGGEGETAQGESWDAWSDSLQKHKVQSPSEEPLSSLKQKEQPSGSRPARRRPTHFITFRANTPGILSGFKRLQEEVCALLPSTTPHWLTSSTLHVTMCLLVLDGPEEVEAAAEILRRFAYLDRNPPLALTFPLKLKHFNGRVLYLSPQPPQRLQELNRGLQEAFWEAGMLHQNSFSPRYHLTLAKVSGVERERVFDGVGELKVGKGLNLGRLPVNTLHMCAMGRKENEEFYEIVCSVTLR
ncbi:leukocyte receptor cluster member 9 isoform X1 [Gadus chalcogrammus]|uniref:leukocyte receptor cluster member 9 isoform X1 n=1 Tax=Gadus chalcogrammus TaxID=1042646 RepID=UPI0024C49270|nr:leukocyte receptor cluster member 9 isoform X1 [Gadus chalcogrammus]